MQPLQSYVSLRGDLIPLSGRSKSHVGNRLSFSVKTPHPTSDTVPAKWPTDLSPLVREVILSSSPPSTFCLRCRLQQSLLSVTSSCLLSINPYEPISWALRTPR